MCKSHRELRFNPIEENIPIARFAFEGAWLNFFHEYCHTHITIEVVGRPYILVMHVSFQNLPNSLRVSMSGSNFDTIAALIELDTEALLATTDIHLCIAQAWLDNYVSLFQSVSAFNVLKGYIIRQVLQPMTSADTVEVKM